jgi:hypothetical protein
MKVAGEYTFDGPRDVVWEMLLDPTVLARVLPGAEKLERVGENEYEGQLKIKVGPVQGDFQGKVRLEDIVPPESCTMQVDGRGAAGFVKATGRLRLALQGNRTQMAYDADAQVGGRLAAVGQRLVDSAARAIIAQSLEGLNAAVKAKVAAQSSPSSPAASSASAAASGPPAGSAVETTAAAEFRKPTQTQFAASVAREVARDLIPPGARRALIAIIIVVVLIVIWMVMT